MAKRQADTELERELSVNSPASKKPRFAEADFRNGHLNGREWEQDERNHQDILAAADLEASELQEAVQDLSESPEPDDDEDKEETQVAVPQRQAQPVEPRRARFRFRKTMLDITIQYQCLCLSGVW